MSTTEVTKKPERVEAQEVARPFAPAVDIRETNGETVLVADMPGVNDQAADVRLENNLLTIEGKGAWEAPTDRRLIHEEFRARTFRRAFEVSDSIDRAGITARMKNGVLRVTLPEGEEAKPRKIQITQE